MANLRTEGCLGIPEIVDTEAPFSNFDFVEQKFGINPIPLAPLKRILSQARMCGFKSMVLEEIDSVGFSSEDDIEIRESGRIPSDKKLIRLSFFIPKITKIEDLEKLSNDDFLGYAIAKQVPFGSAYRWIIFESIICPSRHDNNFYHSKKQYRVRIHKQEFMVTGNIYCQQNDLTNVCAHVALRTCLSATDSFDDFSYREMNRILREKGMPHTAGSPLSTSQVRCILDTLGVKHTAQWYPAGPEHPNVPFQKFIYGSIESRCPAMLGFNFGGAVGHIIPIIGHTFNEDTWVPQAETSYFRIGSDTRYVPSESWVSSYLCHDDNFGSNYCLPRQYMTDKNISLFVIGILPKEVEYDSVDAEAIAIDYLYSIANYMTPDQKNPWLRRLREAILVKGGWVVLRPVFMKGPEYIEHLKKLRGWDEESIRPDLLDIMSAALNDNYWVVEVSLPELFPANKRKLGEIVLKADVPKTPQRDLTTFCFARFVDRLLFIEQDAEQNLQIRSYDAHIKTHTQLVKHS